MSQNTEVAGNRSGRRSSSLIAIAAAIGIVVVVTGILEARVALTDGVEPKNPLTVDRVAFEVQDSYTRPVSYLGLVTAGRKATLGFEIPGQIAMPGLARGGPGSDGARNWHASIPTRCRPGARRPLRNSSRPAPNLNWPSSNLTAKKNSAPPAPYRKRLSTIPACGHGHSPPR